MWALSVVSILVSFALQPGRVHDEATTPPPIQVQGAHVRLTLSPDGVRFAISGDLADWRLEVVTEQGQPVFDSAVRFERELDWGLTDPQGQPVETGVYAYTLTIHLRDSATPRLQRGQWLVERTGSGHRVVTLNATVSDDVPLTVEESPEALPTRTEVPPDATAAGIRAASPGATLSQKTLSPATFGAALTSLSGAGTTGRLVKWTDGPNSVVGDTNISEANGSVVIGAGTYSGALQIYGPANDDVFAGMGPDLINGPAFNFGYAGSSFGRGAGFFNVRPDASAVAPNPSLRFMTANVQRMIITNAGDVGIGTSTPGAKLDVAGGIRGTTSTGAQFAGVSGYGKGLAYTYGVYGFSDSTVAVVGESATGPYGVSGYAGGSGTGVYGNSANGSGVIGNSSSHFGVGGFTTSGYGIYGTNGNSNTTGFAGYFFGRVHVSGNVGIGTPAPNRALTVFGTGGTYLNVKGDSGAEEILMGADSSGGLVSTMTSHDLRLATDGGSHMVIVTGAFGDILPAQDDYQYLGDGSHRWNAVFAVNGVVNTSDARLKQNVKDLTLGLSSLTKLRPVSFEWKDKRDGRRHLGLLAQEVGQVLPEVVHRDADPNAPLGINYTDLIPVVIKAIQDQQALVEQKDAQIKLLEARLAAIETALAQLMKSRR